MPAAVKTTKGKPKAQKYTIDVSVASKDNVLDPSDFEKYLKEHVKVNNKLNNLGDSVTIQREKDKIAVTASIPLAKRYLKYLTKKYLKKNQVRDYLRVVATSKASYELKYLAVSGEDDEE